MPNRQSSKNAARPIPEGKNQGESGWRDSDQDFTNYGDGAYDYQSPGDAHRMTSPKEPYLPGDSFSSEASRENATRSSKGDALSDEQVCEEARARIGRLEGMGESRVNVIVKNGEVTLTGTISHDAAKPLVEDAVANVRGVKGIHNQLRVSRGERPTVRE